MRPQTHFKTVNPLKPAAINLDEVFRTYFTRPEECIRLVYKTRFFHIIYFLSRFLEYFAII